MSDIVSRGTSREHGATSGGTTTLATSGTPPRAAVEGGPSSADIRSALANRGGWKSLIVFFVLALAWIAGFSARLFAVIRFESIIHEFDPWSVRQFHPLIALNARDSLIDHCCA